MSNIRIYTTPGCVYCVLAKQLLMSLGATYQEIDLRSQPELRMDLQEAHNWWSVPMIFFGEKFMGGYDDINRLHQRGELELLLSSS